jgi:hypothetical protein
MGLYGRLGYDEPIGDVSTGMRTTAGTALPRRPMAPVIRKCRRPVTCIIVGGRRQGTDHPRTWP